LGENVRNFRGGRATLLLELRALSPPIGAGWLPARGRQSAFSGYGGQAAGGL